MEYGQVVSRKSLADEEETVDEVPDDALALLSQSIAGRISLDGLQTVPLVTEEKEGAETEEQVVTEESNLAFSLFSDVHQVSLEEKEEVIKQERPLSYYMVEDNEERRERLKQSLLTYEQIMEFSNEPWPACQKPHKVIHIKLEEKKKKRWRPSKKRRIRMKIIREQKERQALQRKRFPQSRRGRGKPRFSRAGRA